MSLSLSKKRRNRECHTNNDEIPSTSKRAKNDTAQSEISILSQSQVVSPVRCGKIISIHLENFMCHANLTIDFNQRVNFLVGSNGSGKSAIMAALVLGLGSRARATNRSGSMKQFIKTGENSAKIEIKISNKGFESYEHEVYGDSITVIRNISQTSANYVIKNDNGNVVSRKLDDLTPLLVFHNIQTDNPIFVLNQDHAREFLKELDPHKNYRMFLKATQIELVTEKLNDSLHIHKEQRIRLQCLKKKILKAHKELKELKGKLDILINLESLKDELKSLEVEHMWLLVAQREQEFNEYVEEVVKLQSKVEELKRGTSSKSAIEAKFNSEISNFSQEKAQEEQIYKNVRARHTEIKNKINHSNQSLQEIELIIQRYKKKMSFTEEQVLALQKHIEDQALVNTDEIKKQNELNLTKLKKSLHELEAMMTTTKNDLKSFQINKSQNDETFNQLKSQKVNYEARLKHLNLTISNINVSSKDSISTFGNEMVQLVTEIKNVHRAGKFSEMPRGPIGQYVQVPDSKYRDIVETQLGALVKAFLVANSRDRQILEAIIRKICPQLRITIITMKFSNKVYNVSNGCVLPPNGTKLLMNEIKCSDPVVTNCLIDRLQVETVLLTDSKDTAESICQRENVPVNMSKVLVSKYKLEYYPEPKYRMYSMQIRPARFIQVDVKQRINALNQEKAKFQNEIEQLENEIRQLLSNSRNDAKRVDDLQKVLREQQAKQIELKSEIDAIKNYEYPQHNEIDMLQAEINENKQKIIDMDLELRRKKEEVTNKIQEIEVLEAEENDVSIKMQETQRKIESIDKNIDDSQRKINRLASTFKECQKQLQTLSANLSEKLCEKEKKEKELDNKMKEAAELGERISTEREEEEILDCMAKLQAKLRQKSNITENVQELKISIRKKKSDVESESSVYEKLKFSVDMLGKSLRTRFCFIQKLKQHMVLLLQYTFNYLLKARDFVGSVDVDHQQQTLLLSVIPRDKHLENALSSTRALSGGERSYSTVAFLVSLWACVDHPFYFLDEYDVFTDVVNRESLTKLLLNEGKLRPNRQYTFLTPQDMSLKSDDIVKIHRLQPPERR